MQKNLISVTTIRISLLTIIGLLIISVLFNYSANTGSKNTKDLTNNQEVSPQNQKNKRVVDQTANNKMPTSLKEAVTKAQYKAKTINEKLVATNHANKLKAEFDSSGLSLRSSSKSPIWQSSWRLKSMGYGDRQNEVKNGELISKDQRVEIKRKESDLVEWFENRPSGLEHGYTLAKRPVKAVQNTTDSLRLVMEVSGDLKAEANQNGQALTLKDSEGKEVLQYRKLKVWDADNQEQVARMQVADNKVFLEVEEADAKYPLTIDPTFTEQQKLLASDGAAGGLFGSSVSISGGTAIVGSPFDDIDGAVPAGSAYIFEWDGANWTEQQKLTSSDGATGDEFGYSVSMSGDTAIVGAYLDDENGSGSGSAYIFVRSGGVWTEQQKLISSDNFASDAFGKSVSISGDTAIIAAYGNDDYGSASGSAYVFVRSGGVWTEQQKLLASDGAAVDNFGWSVSISGDTAIVGAYLDDENGINSGSAYIFIRSGGVWTEQQKLLASNGAAGFVFGRSVSISGDTVIVGSYGNNDNGVNSGSAYIFVRSGGVWTEQQKLLASDNGISDLFGWSVAISGDTAIVGAMREGDNGTFSGTAYIFKRNGASWTEQQKLLASDGSAHDELGFSVAVSGATAVVGAHQDDDNGSNSGSAYIFASGPTTLTVTKTADTNDGTCDSDCSLREAIAAANAAATDDTIEFALPLFDAAQTITLGGTALTMDNNGKTTIDGPGANLLTISGNNASRVFYVSNGAEVEVNGVTISDGRVFTSGQLGGGGILNDGGVVTVNNSTIRDNLDVNGGAGIWNGDAFFNLYVGTITINNSTISNNVSDTPSGGGSGGGIRNNLGTVSLNNSTLSGNSGVNGGGIFNDGGGTLNLRNSTLVNNSPTGSIGGVWNYGGSLVITNTIIANNTNGDCAGSSSTNYSLIENGSCFGGSGNLSGDPNLGPLQDNGGPTFTHTFLGSSPAIDAGNNALILSGVTNDQRGDGFPRIVNSTVDIGSVEVGTGGPVDQIITFGGLAAMTYGDVPFVVSASSDSGLAVSLAISGDCSVSGNMVTITGAGSCTITASQAGDGTYNAAPNVDQSFTISKATLTVSPNNQTITFGDSDPTFTFGYSGFVSPDNSGDIDTESTCGVSGVHSDAGAYTITCSGGTDENYDFSYNTSTLTVNKAAQTTTFGTLDDKTYGNGTIGVSAYASSGLTVSFTATGNCTILGNTVTITGAGSCTITASQIGDGNYNAAPDVDQVFNIGKASLSVTPDSQTITFGDADPTYTFSYSGFIVPDGSTVIGTEPTCIVAGVHTDAGDYPITCSGGLDNNYSFNYGAATLTIEKADQTITFAALADKTFGDAPFVVSATANSSLTVSFAASGDCTVLGSTVTITGAGSCNITASQSGNGNYNAASDVDQDLTINKADQTINFAALADKTFGDVPFNVSATSTSGLAVSFAASGDCSIIGSTVTITGAGNCTITASQDGDDDYNAASVEDQSFTINQAVLDVDPDNQQIIFGSPDPTYTFSYSGFVNGENSGIIDTAPTCGVTGAHSGIGSYTINCSGGVDNNYSFNYGTATLNVIYNFNGFFNPIDNLNMNNVKAGRGIPVKFSLSGDFGLNILAAGYPVSYETPCSGSGDDGAEIPTVTAGNSSLSYSSGSDQYKYVWKTEKSWTGTCRTLVVGLNDGTFHTANFKFK